jgi:hypothetical protein
MRTANNLNLGAVNIMLAKAIDTCNAKLACELVDMLRVRGMNYDEIFRLVQSVRPDFDAVAWDALLYEGDDDAG